ncbi:MAG: hypothetical protein V1833_03280 [Elusimicrobiota bacterium]
MGWRLGLGWRLYRHKPRCHHNDKPTIGLLLVKQRNKMVAEYAGKVKINLADY